MNDDYLKQIEQLQNQIAELQRKINEYEKVLREHQHNGFDGSVKIVNSHILLKDGYVLASGPGHILGIKSPAQGIDELIIGCGPEGMEEGVVGTKTRNMQMNFQYSPGLCAIMGMAEPIMLSAPFSVYNGQTSLTTSVDLGADNSRVGQYLVIRKKTTTVGEITDYGYQIIANTKNTITFTPAIQFSGEVEAALIYKPVFFGGSVFQWQRLYTLEGTSGGIRFGPGQTGNGQNGLLYMDTDGSLKYRKPNGTVVTIVSA